MDLKRANPHLNEFVLMMDEVFFTAGGSIPVAWDRIGGSEKEFMKSEIKHCILDPRYYLENYHTIRTEQDGLKTMSPFWDSQELFYEEVMKLYRKNGKVLAQVLKARQLGLSTICEGLIFWKTLFTPTCNALIVASDMDKVDHQFEMSRLAYDCLPWWMQPEVRYEQKGRVMVFDRRDELMRKMSPGLRSNIYVEAANKSTGVARGKTIRAAHMCLSDKNLVMDCTGRVRSIADVEVGYQLLTDDGYKSVPTVSWRPASSVYPGADLGYKVTTWCNAALPVEGTGNHKVLTGSFSGPLGRYEVVSKGMTPLIALTRQDSLVIPVVPVTDKQAFGGNEEVVGGTNGHGGAVSKWKVPAATREFGFAVGLYLAEGSALRNKVAISIDADEQHLVDRFAAAVGEVYGEPQHGQNGSRTRVYYFHNTAMARWFERSIGAKDEKRMPPWMWNVGRDFLAGVVEGAIMGDGHLSAFHKSIAFSSTRVSLAAGIREAVASLGHGYGCITTRGAGFHYGRNCQQIWTITFTDVPNQSLRTEYAWENQAFTATPYSLHWAYSADKTKVYVRIRKIERVELDTVYDIEIDSPDHVYRLASALTANSELATWECGGETLTEQIFPSMNATDTMAFMESTAEGRSGFWYQWWKDTEDGKTDWHPIFIPFYKVRKYSQKIEKAEQFLPTPDEEEFRAAILRDNSFYISNEVLKWRRKTIAQFVSLTGDEFGFMQEFPANSLEAFQGKGVCAFNKRLLHKMLSACQLPTLVGEINLDMESGVPKPQLRHIQSGDVLHNPKTFDRLWVWEPPDPNAMYYVAADVAQGNEGGDFSVVEVLKIGAGMEPDEQVAEWRGWMNPTPFAYVIASLGHWYNDAEISVECNGVGKVTNNEIYRVIEYPNLYRWKHLDKIKNSLTNFLGWETTYKSREAIIAKMAEAVNDRSITLRSRWLVDEMMDFAYDEDGGGKAQGQATKDDRVMATMICRYCAHDSDYGKKAMARPMSSSSAGVGVWYILDPENRKVGEYRDHASALQAFDQFRVKANLGANRFQRSSEPGRAPLSGYSILQAPQPKDYANTLYSPIHNGYGIRSRMFYDMGYSAESINHEAVMWEQQAEQPPDEHDPNAWLNY